MKKKNKKYRSSLIVFSHDVPVLYSKGYSKIYDRNIKKKNNYLRLFRFLFQIKYNRVKMKYTHFLLYDEDNLGRFYTYPLNVYREKNSTSLLNYAFFAFTLIKKKKHFFNNAII